MTEKLLPEEIYLSAVEAEALDRFTIEKLGIRYVVVERMAENLKRRVRTFNDEAQALEYLAAKLPPIPETRGDIVR